MIIAGISVSLVRGGAGIAAERLFQGMERQPGVSLYRFIARRDPGSPAAALFTELGRFRVVADQVVDVLKLASHPAWQAWNAQTNRATLLRMLGDVKPDVINLQGFNQWFRPAIPYADWLRLAERAPLVWTLQDLWPVTGCCDYLTECPSIRDRPESTYHSAESDRSLCAHSRQLWERNRESWNEFGDRIAFVGSSRWISNLARRWCGDSVRIETIPCGVDLGMMTPHDREAARSALGWPAEAQLVLAIAERLDGHRKGMPLLMKAFARMSQKARLVTVGAADTRAAYWPPGTIHAGTIDDLRLLRLIYSAVDAVVVPSLIDNLPNVLLEGLACGTPGVGFAVGGIPDIIRPGVTGWLAPAEDVDGLARALDEAVSAPREQREQLRKSCRRVAEEDYDHERLARRYLALFESLVRR